MFLSVMGIHVTRALLVPSVGFFKNHPVSLFYNQDDSLITAKKNVYPIRTIMYKD